MYRKPTHTGKYLDFQSNHPVAHKRAVVSSLLTRAKRICKDGNNLEAELKIVRRELSGNGYPQHFVERIEKQILQPKAANRKVFTTTAGIPYVRGISEALARIFADYDLRIGHVPASKLRNELVKVKDPLPDNRFPGVVYRVPCADCNHVYIGETGKFPRRMKEHERDVKQKKVASNAIAEHAHKHQHDIDWDNAAILCKERNVTSRLLLESSFIQTHSDTMNRNEGTLPLIYMRSLRHKLHL